MTAAGMPILDLIDDFERSLRARRKAPKTIVAYTDAARRFATYAEAQGLPTDVGAVERRHIEQWIISEIEAHSPSTAAGRYRYLQQFWRWVVEEGERPTSPMEGMSPPAIPERPHPSTAVTSSQRCSRRPRAPGSSYGGTMPSCGCSSAPASAWASWPG